MKKSIKLLVIFSTLITFITTQIKSQHLFQVSYNDLPQETVTQLNTQISNIEIVPLSPIRNNENKETWQISFSEHQNTKIVILNSQNGKNVTITPADKTLTQFQLAPFFIEELRQSVLGETDRYLIVETDTTFSIKKVSEISATRENQYLPRYRYGTKENIKEATPKDRKIIHIFSQKPRLIHIYTTPEQLEYIAQREEAMSYYVYMYRLPDGTLCTYDEHHNTDNSLYKSRTGTNLHFDLSGNLNAQQTAATEFAFNLWSEQLAGRISVDISVNSTDMGDPSIIGSSTRMPDWLHLGTNTYYPSALWNQIVDYDATLEYSDIQLQMNSQFNFYYGIDGNPGGSQIDWITIMLHEVCHGLGFFPICRQDGYYIYATSPSYGTYTDYPGIFDRQLFEGLAGPCLTTLDRNQRSALLRSNNLYSGAPGSNLLTANGGNRVKMYAPAVYAAGSTGSHWDNIPFPFQTWMKSTVSYGFALHSFNDRKIGMMLDIGWLQPGATQQFTVTVTFAGETINIATQTVELGDYATEPTDTPEREGYVFSGWYSDNETFMNRWDFQTHIVPANLTLWAKWIDLSLFCDGTGVVDDPFLICNSAQLDLIRNHLDKNFKLSNDIDLTDYLAPGGAGYDKWGTNGWLPIGNEIIYSLLDPAPFTGTFDGNGYRITGFWFDRNTDKTGLFGKTDGATIKNLGIEFADKGIKGRLWVGGLVALNNNSNISNCYTTGNILHNGIANYDAHKGGLVSINNNSEINNCYSKVNITGEVTLGGLVYKNDNNSIISNCYTTGNISGRQQVAGLVYYNDNSIISNCYTTGNVTGQTGDIAGLVSYNIYNSTITNCYTTGNITSGNINIGGLVGQNRDFSTIINCYTTANMTAPPSYQNGGLIGWHHSGATVQNSYYNTETTGFSGTGKGTPKTTSQMKQQDTFDGWDFATLWGICEDFSYPFFRWQWTGSDYYTVSVENDGNGTGTATPSCTVQGEEITLTANPNEGYQFKNWEVISGGITIAANNTFQMPANDVTVKVHFELSSSGGNLPEIVNSLKDGKLGDIYGPEPLKISGDEPIVWEITDGKLPNGLRLNKNSGVISGKPSRAGTFTITVKATNSAGSVSKVLLIWVEALCFE